MFDDEKAHCLVDAVLFVADYGDRFLPLYDFDPQTGSWRHQQDDRAIMRLSLQENGTDSLETDSTLADPLS